MRIIASMTTIPSRIDRIRPALESVIGQTAAIEHIEVNVPYVCARTNESYVVPTWLDLMDRVKVFRTDDYGPITKVAPTLLRYKDDQHAYIWSVDDDIAYPSNQIEMLCRCHRPEEIRILCRYGGNFNPDGSIAFMFGRLEVQMFEGFGTVLYPPACVGEDFAEYLKITSDNSDCRLSDDVVLSFYFFARRIPIYLCNSPSETEPFDLAGALPYSREKDALSFQDGGHLQRYKRVFNFLHSIFPTIETQFSPAGVTTLSGRR
jgi:hypothetical protein